MKRRTFFRSAMTAAAATAFSGPHAYGALYRVATQEPVDVNAVTGDGRAVTLKASAIQELRSSLRGRLLLAKSEGYDAARQVLNPMIDKRPALIVQPTGTVDVRNAVAFARAHNLLVAVKCGGHSSSGQSTCDRGMQIDLSGMRGVRVDPRTRRAWVAGGALLGLVDHEAAPYGLVTPLGTVSHTGVGGLTTGGGMGRVARRFGLALDNVVSVDVVTADGEYRHADKDENSDLLWGVRGGGGNFGVVTSFEFQLHPMQQQVIGGRMAFPIARANELLAFYAEYSATAPDDLYLDCAMARPPGGAPGVVSFSLCYSGKPGDADRVLAPLRKLGTPLSDNIKAIDYVALQRANEAADPRARASYLKSGFTPQIKPELIKAMIDGLEAHPARASVIAFQHCGGAISRVPTNATAFPHRYASHNVMISFSWNPGDDGASHIQAGRKLWAGLEQFTQGFYMNGLTGDEASGTVNANYLENYQRLVTVKNKYDPTNLFRLNANVQPR